MQKFQAALHLVGRFIISIDYDKNKVTICLLHFNHN